LGLLQNFLEYLDFPTLEVVLLSSFTLSAVAMLVLRRLNPAERGPGLWALACASLVVGLGVRPLVFLGPLRQLAFLGFPLSLLLGFEGIMRFRGFGWERERRRFLPALFLLLVALMVIAGDHARFRSLLIDGFMSITLFLSAFCMLRGSEGLELLVNGVAALGCVVMGSSLAFRWTLAFEGLIGAQVSEVSRLVYLAAVLWNLMTWSFGMSMAVMLRARQYIERLADFDGLTGLPNRRTFDRSLDELLPHRGAGNRPFAVVFVDLNGLKSINDSHGHPAGDAALILVARALERALEGGQMASRFGGDEFVLLDRNAVNWSDVEAFEKRIRRRVEREHKLEDGTRIFLRISIGSALYPDDGERASDLFHVADQRMYREKQMYHAPTELY